MRLLLIALALLLAGCATGTAQIAEYRNPTGEVRRCQPDMGKLTFGVLLTDVFALEMARLRECKDDAERNGFVRTPAGQENEETKQMIRDADAARAASIRKP